MKKFLFSLIVLLTPAICSADCYWVWIDKVGYVEPGEEGGHSAKGDVVSVSPCNDKPMTAGEEPRFIRIKVDLTEDEKNALLSPEYEKPGDDTSKPIKNRKLSVNVDNLKGKNNGIATKAEFNKEVAVKLVPTN